MDDNIKQLLADLAEFIRPIANGNTESPHYIRSQAEQLIKRIAHEIELAE